MTMEGKVWDVLGRGEGGEGRAGRRVVYQGGGVEVELGGVRGEGERGGKRT